MKRSVTVSLEVAVDSATSLEFQIAVARRPGLSIDESLTFTMDDGVAVDATEIESEHGSRIHLFDASPGTLRAEYAATVVGSADPDPVTPQQRSMYLRPSRYAEADKLFGFAGVEFDEHSGDEALLAEISSWVGRRLSYVPGSSDPIDGAIDTMLAGAGVCRDYAHLVVALLRAVKIPARLAAVYAPGCSPMDFHAVAEAAVGGVWRAVDATCLAPRSTMLRIATGRDAADTAFLDNHGGAITLLRTEVTAFVDGPLPVDNVADLVSIG